MDRVQQYPSTAELLASADALTPLVDEQATTLCASWAARMPGLRPSGRSIRGSRGSAFVRSGWTPLPESFGPARRSGDLTHHDA